MKNKLIGFGLAVLVILVIAAGSGIFYVGQFAGWDYNDTGITNSAGQTIDQRATAAAQGVVTNLINTNTVYQSGLLTNYAGSFYFLNAPGTTNVGVTGEVYTVTSLISGLSAWTNSNGGGMCLVSNYYNNGSSNCWAFESNTVVYYYSKALNSAGYPEGSGNSTWTALNGTGTKPSIQWYRIYTNIYNPQTASFSKYPLMLTNLNQDVHVETNGTDSQGVPGLYPFLTLQGALASMGTNYAGTIFMGQGYFPASLNNPGFNPAPSLSIGQSVVGKGINVTVVGDFITNNVDETAQATGDQYIYPTGSNSIENMTILSVIEGGTVSAGTFITNLNHDKDVVIGNTNAVDCFFGVVGTAPQMMNVTMNNVHGITAWDFDQGVLSGTYDNVVVDCVYNGLTNNNAGGHGMLVGSLSGSQGGYRLVRGGTFNVSGFSSNATPLISYVYNNACLDVINTNNQIILQGPNFNHWNNGLGGTNDYAIYNASGCTNITGWFYDNGILTYVNGTNFTQVKTNGITNFSALDLP